MSQQLFPSLTRARNKLVVEGVSFLASGSTRIEGPRATQYIVYAVAVLSLGDY